MFLIHDLLVIAEMIATLDIVVHILIFIKHGKTVFLNKVNIIEVTITDSQRLIWLNVSECLAYEIAVIIIQFVDERNYSTVWLSRVV